MRILTFNLQRKCNSLDAFGAAWSAISEQDTWDLMWLSELDAMHDDWLQHGAVAELVSPHSIFPQTAVL